MIRKTPAEKVQAYFRKFERAHLVLPDGWYGRPYDSFFALTLAEDTPSGLEIELEGGRKLIFEGDIDVAKSHFEKYPALKIEQYLSFHWRPNQGVLPASTYEADSGPVFFVR